MVECIENCQWDLGSEWVDYKIVEIHTKGQEQPRQLHWTPMKNANDKKIKIFPLPIATRQYFLLTKVIYSETDS